MATCSLYEVLGVPWTADKQQIKAAYRRLARSCHPDVVCMRNKQHSASEFIKIHAAYTTLCDPLKRASCDRQHLLFNFNTTFTATTNWESDQCW